MDSSAVPWRAYLDLISGTGNDDHALGTAFEQLTAAVRAAVPTFCGMRVTMTEEGRTVHLDVFPRAEPLAVITTSLRLPLSRLRFSSPDDGHIVFYATTPGAFVDLAADLDHLLEGPSRLDSDLPPATQQSGMTGFDEVSTISRAIGILIAEGCLPGAALAALHEQASAAGLSPYAFAVRLLRR